MAAGARSPGAPTSEHAHLAAVTPEMDRRNGLIYCASYTLKYFAAPVAYVGVVQAALCDKLGAGPTLANLPAAAYLFGHFAPLVLASLVPHRAVRSMVVAAQGATALLLGAVFTVLILPTSAEVRIAGVILQALVQGFSGSISNVYAWQCLGRGTTLEGRARTLKLTYTLGPIAAVAGSLFAQLALSGRIPLLPYPWDFAAIYLAGAICYGVSSQLSRRYQLVPIPEEPRQPLFASLAESIRSYSRSRSLVMLWVAYLCWYGSLSGMSNLSLYTREATGHAPKELSGIIMALRFGCKAVAGFGLGVLALRHGIRAPMTATVVLLGVAVIWAWAVPGYAFLLAFGLLGAGELGGAYFPNYVVAVSGAAAGTRNLAMLTLVSTAASVAPVIYGTLTEAFGFRASFVFGLALATAGLLLVRTLPKGTKEPERA